MTTTVYPHAIRSTVELSVASPPSELLKEPLGLLERDLPHSYGISLQDIVYVAKRGDGEPDLDYFPGGLTFIANNLVGHAGVTPECTDTTHIHHFCAQTYRRCLFWGRYLTHVSERFPSRSPPPLTMLQVGSHGLEKIKRESLKERIVRSPSSKARYRKPKAGFVPGSPQAFRNVSHIHPEQTSVIGNARLSSHRRKNLNLARPILHNGKCLRVTPC